MGDGITDNGGSTGSDPITGFYSEPFWTEVNSEESYCPARRDGRNFAPVEVEGRYVCPTDHVGVLERPNSFSEGHPSDAFDSVIDGQSNHDAAPQLAATTEEATGHQASWQSCNSDFMISLGLHNGFGREQTSIFSGGGYFIVGTDRADFALAMPMQIMSAVHACQESGYFTTDQANAISDDIMILVDEYNRQTLMMSVGCHILSNHTQGKGLARCMTAIQNAP